MPRPCIRPTVPRFSSTFWVSAALLLAAPAAATAQGTLADYERADSFAARTRGLVVDVTGTPIWIGDTGRLWYRKSVEGGNRFVLVDPSAAGKTPTFDHERLARSLSAATSDAVTAVTLPFERFTFVDGERAIEFVLDDSTWRCGLAAYVCENQGALPKEEEGGRNFPWSAGPGQLWRMNDGDPVQSPNGELEAFIQNYNVAVRSVGSDDYTLLSRDGSEGNTYTRASIEVVSRLW